VGARQHRDRVELHRAQSPQHRRRSAAAAVDAEQALGAQREAARLVGR
jgi:hypothetical protein